MSSNALLHLARAYSLVPSPTQWCKSLSNNLNFTRESHADGEDARWAEQNGIGFHALPDWEIYTTEYAIIIASLLGLPSEFLGLVANSVHSRLLNLCYAKQRMIITVFEISMWSFICWETIGWLIWKSALQCLRTFDRLLFLWSIRV